MPIQVKKVSNLAQFTEAISHFVEEWSDAEQGEVTLWCRGQRDAAWGLVPGEYRLHEPNSEEIFSEFELKARPLLREVPQSEWEWYFLMQHYGLPTRLLDWTAGALLALYFALRDEPGENDAAVWVIDPWELNKQTTGKAELIVSSEAIAQKYLPSKFFGGKKLPKAPIAIVPPYNSSRITVQRGTFTIHGSNRHGVEQIFGSRMAKIEIPKGSAFQMKRALRASGIGEFTVFPELDGLCREIRAVEIDGC